MHVQKRALRMYTSLVMPVYGTCELSDFDRTHRVIAVEGVTTHAHLEGQPKIHKYRV